MHRSVNCNYVETTDGKYLFPINTCLFKNITKRVLNNQARVDEFVLSLSESGIYNAKTAIETNNKILNFGFNKDVLLAFFKSNYTIIKDFICSLSISIEFETFWVSFKYFDYDKRVKFDINFDELTFNPSEKIFSSKLLPKYDYRDVSRDDTRQICNALGTEEIKLTNLYFLTGDIDFAFSKCDKSVLKRTLSYKKLTGNKEKIWTAERKNAYINYILGMESFQIYFKIFLKAMYMASGINKDDLLKRSNEHTDLLNQILDRIITGYESAGKPLPADAISSISEISETIFNHTKNVIGLLDDGNGMLETGSDGFGVRSLVGRPRPILGEVADVVTADPDIHARVAEKALEMAEDNGV